MTTPVAPSAPSTRPGRAQDRPDPAGAAGFASALDGALAGGREPVGRRAPDARSERRDPDTRAADAADRAADKAADAADRAADKASRAAERATDAAARAAARTDRAADRADRPDGAPAPDGVADDAAVDGTDAESVEQPSGTEQAPGRTGLPAAIWALLMGRTAATSAEAATGEPVRAAPAIVRYTAAVVT